jgi:hypothetical protein
VIRPESCFVSPSSHLHRRARWSAALLHARAARLHADAADYFRSIGRPDSAALEQTFAELEHERAARQLGHLVQRPQRPRPQDPRPRIKRTVRTRRHGPAARREPWAAHTGRRGDDCNIIVSIGHHGVVVVHVDGEVDETTIPALDELLDTLNRDQLPFLLDCSKVAFASAGLIECLDRHDAVRRLLATSRSVQRLYDIAGAPPTTDPPNVEPAPSGGHAG